MSTPALMRWLNEDTGLVHLVEEDQGWRVIYCTWRTLEQQYELTAEGVPTCVRCVAHALKYGRKFLSREGT